LNRGVSPAIDRFTINDQGEIQHMIVYTAPANRWMTL
jgi:hypothetical protein